MLASDKRAAMFTLWLTGLGICLIPVDWLLQFAEQRAPDEPSPPNEPHIFVCGPARSGTTLIYQVLADNLAVTYPRNFTLLFSKSPLVASKLFSRWGAGNSNPNYENYYGKTDGMQAPSEANHLWNQWVDSDNSGFRTRMTDCGASAMGTFFRRFSAQLGMPTLSKNNNINAFANVVADQLPNSHFICLRRDTRYLAQSLLQARLEINGDIDQSYGVTMDDISSAVSDPFLHVIRQIEFLDKLAIDQQNKIGAERFWIVDYEAFCEDPADLINKINTHVLKQTHKLAPTEIPRIECNNKIVDPDLFARVMLTIEMNSATDTLHKKAA